MTKVVLDASALLAVINQEPGADVVLASLSDAVISAVNYSEVLKKTLERGATLEPVVEMVTGWPIEVAPFDEAHARSGAELYPHTKQHGLSFADRACLALGVHRKCKVLTAERRMGLVQLPIKVQLIRNHDGKH